MKELKINFLHKTLVNSFLHNKVDGRLKCVFPLEIELLTPYCNLYALRTEHVMNTLNSPYFWWKMQFLCINVSFIFLCKILRFILLDTPFLYFTIDSWTVKRHCNFHSCYSAFVIENEGIWLTLWDFEKQKKEICSSTLPVVCSNDSTIILYRNALQKTKLPKTSHK